MKRHLIVLAPLAIFLFFVGCGGGSDPAPIPAAVAALPEVKKAECSVKQTIRTCQDSAGPLAVLIASRSNTNQSGGQDNTALILAALNKKNAIPPAVPTGDCGSPIHADNNSELSCHDSLINTLLTLKSTYPDPNGPSLWSKYQDHFVWELRSAADKFGNGLPLSPLQRLQLAQSLQGALGQSGLSSSAGLNPSNVAYVNQALAAYGNGNGAGSLVNNNTMTLGNGSTQNTLGATLNQNSGVALGSNTYAPTNSAGIRSTSLNLGMGARSSTSTLSSTGTGTATRQVLDANDLKAAKGFGLSKDNIGQ